ncbi:hypothetical protein, partial [Aeromonas veronii]|uniref:hypothetical protein n=1 Tax=Aeromonas veronii TaxID=654 RepID=UPI003D1D1DC6
GYHQSAVGHLSPFIHECRTYYLNSRLSHLYAEKEVRLKTTKSEEYAATKDRLILAVEWVVQKCFELKQQRA